MLLPSVLARMTAFVIFSNRTVLNIVQFLLTVSRFITVLSKFPESDIDLITVLEAILTGRQTCLEITVFGWKNFASEKFINWKLKALGKGFSGQNVSDVAVLDSVQ